MGSRQVRQRHSVMRLIGEIKLLLNDEDSLYSPRIREGVFSETQHSPGRIDLCIGLGLSEVG
jgi:hypothetical protein